MKNKLLGVKILSVILSFALFLFLTPGCGDGGGSGSGGPASSSSKISSKKPVASFIGHVNAKTGEITFEYPDGSTSNDKGSAKKLYTSQPPGSLKNVTLSSSGLTWSAVPKTLTGLVKITNNTVPNGGPGETLYGTYATIEGFSVGGVSVNNEYGYDPNGYPYFNHAVGGESLASGAQNAAGVSWQFYDPSAVSFNFWGNVYADNWKQIAGNGIASTAWENADVNKGDKLFIGSMTKFNNKLYLTLGKQVHPARNTGSANDFQNGVPGVGITGAEIWEYEPSSSVWTKVSAPGFDGSQDGGEDYLNFDYNNWGTCLAEFKNSLYAGTAKAAIFGNGQTDPDNKQGAEIWHWSGSGTTWTKVHSMTDTKAIKDLLEFDGNLFATGYFRGYNKTPGTVTQSRFDYSSTGTSGWSIVMSDSFGDIDEQGTYGTSISSAVSNVQFGTSDKFLFMAKGGITAKPGAQIYRAGPANGSNKGTTYTNGVITGLRGNGNWTTNGDWTKITDITSDDIYATITSTPVNINGSFMYTFTASFSATPADHALAHHWAHNDTQGRSSITIMDNQGTNIVYAVHASDHVPKYKDSINGIGDKLRLTQGPNERGLSETSNGTSFALFTFAPSSEGTASPVTNNTLGVATNNLPQGVPQYNPSGGELYFSSNAGTSAGTVDSDWVRKLDLFTSNNGSTLGIATPSASGGANFEGLSSIGGFNNRDDFTIAAGSHEGWLYAAIYPFQRADTGFRLYKSADGINWIKITDNGFGRSYGKGFTFVSLNGKFYMSISRQQFSTSVAASGDGTASITSTTSTFYVTDPTFGTPSIRFPSSGTFVLDRVIGAGVDPANYTPETAIVIEKANYTGTKVSTTLTLNMPGGVGLPANDGVLASHVWATDTQIPLSSAASLPASGAIVVEGEVIQYGAKSGTTLISLFDPATTTWAGRGTRGPKDHGVANHPKGAAVFRTTRHLANDYGIVLSGTTGLPIAASGGARRILIDNEEISYNNISGLTLLTPMRKMDATDAGSHGAGAAIYRAGFTGITRGQYGTTATSWMVGESVSGGIVLGTAELWSTE